MKMLAELYAYRTMIATLVRKNLRGRYKGSVLGFMWTFIGPLLQLGIYTMLFSIILNNNTDKYYLFLFVALIPWFFFSNCLAGGAGAVREEKDLVVKIYFPREVIPVYFVTAAFVNMLYCFVIVISVVLLSGVQVSLLAWLSLPVIMIIEYVLALGTTLLVSSATVYFRDLQHFLGIAVLALQFGSPIMYGIEIVPDRLMQVYMLNPLAAIMVAYRDILYYGRVPDFSSLVYSAIFAMVTLIIGFLVFGRLKRYFAEVL